MAVDISEKVVIAFGFIEVSSGVYFTEHDFGSTSTSFVSTLLIVTMCRLVALGPY